MLYANGCPSSGQQGSKITSEQAQRLSQKLDELLGDVAGQAGPTQQRNDRGEGLPIVNISEPMTTPGAPPFDPGPAVEEPDVVPLRALSPQEKAQQRVQMERILDLLEAEEQGELARKEKLEHQRMKEEYEQRKSNTRKKLERLKAAKDMQKKMGKALLRNLSDAREREEKEREEKEKEEQLKRDLEAEASRKQKKPTKKVSFAELPHEGKEDKAPTAGPSKRCPRGGDASGRLHAQEQKATMKIDVVERFLRPMKTKVMSPPPPGDESDDNVQLGLPVPVDSDEGEAIVSDHDSEHIPTSDSDDEEPRSLDKPVVDEEFDFDTAQHHREIVLEYFKKRDSIGIDAARVMSAHSHEPMDEWDQPEVPLEATLSSPHPKPPQSKFRSTVSQAYNTMLPSATPSTSLGGSVLPGTSSTLQSAMRIGKLEGDKLVGGEEGESGEEDDDDVKEFMAALRKGEVTNAGAEQNAETLVAALMKAYTAPEKGEEAAKEVLEDQSKVEAASQTQAKAPAPVPTLSKASKFKLNRFPATAPRSPSDLPDSDPTPISNSVRSSPKLPTSNTVLKRKPGQPPRQAPSILFMPTHPQNCSVLSQAAAKPSRIPAVVELPPFRPPHAGAKSATSQASTLPAGSSSSHPPALSPNFVASPSFSSMIVDSPSFCPPSSAKAGQMPSMVVDSPSFQLPASSRPLRPPLVMSAAVRESTGPRAGGRTSAPEPAKRASKFKAERS
ncbi:hypothetical protein EWM64_g6819 [Hericium alpestre]|uniref:DUF3835 domain-containing protein n=1 Tax=Hericium alpestre TaxID=135208 RepID=A0A4Y9ZSE9_9AGAM|nr:hypothetical protein EWM64_g6819 [Hericium alpestre]